MDFLGSISGFFYFALLLSVIVSIHEFGHLVVAKIFNVYCYEYSIGMGPKLFSKKGKETMYCVRLLPIGGYVAMAGENDGVGEEYGAIEVPPERTIGGIHPFKRILVMLAGVTMNFLLAWLLASSVFLMNGVFYEAPEPIVDSVVADSPAEKAGFKAGDIIRKVTFDGTTIVPETFYDVSTFTMSYDGVVLYDVERDGQILTLSCKGELDMEDGLYYIGIYLPDRKAVKITPLNCLAYGGNYLIDTARSMFISLARIFRGKDIDQLSGPVGIYNVTKETAALGMKNYLLLMSILSLNIGIVNLLPLPVMDGGRVVITFGEWVFNTKMNKKLEYALMIACWVLLIGLMVFITWNDLTKMILQ